MLVDLPLELTNEKAQPNVNTAKVFLIKAGQGVILNKGTWHSPAYCFDGNGVYYFLIERRKDFIDQDEKPWVSFKNYEKVEIVKI